METNKTVEQTTSGVENVRASGPNESVFRWLIFLPAALGSSPNSATEVARQEKRISFSDRRCKTLRSRLIAPILVSHGWQPVHMEICPCGDIHYD